MSLSRRHFLGMLVTSAVALCTPLRALAQELRARVVSIAGVGAAGEDAPSASGHVATEAFVNNPYGVVVGPDGGLWFCEVDTGRTRRLDLTSGIVTTVVGNGQKSYTGDGGPALAAGFSAPHEIRFDASGHLYVVERDAHVVRRIEMPSGMVSTVAGTGEPGFSGDGGPATAAQLRQPHSIAFDADGDRLICDIGNHRVRLVNMISGTISTLSGTGEREQTPDSAPLAGTHLRGPRSIDTDNDGNAYLVLREGNAVFKLDLRAQRLQRIAGTGESGYSGDGGPAIDCRFNGPKGIAWSVEDHSLYIVDTENHVIRRMDLASGIITTMLGTGSVADGPDGDPLQCALARPHGVFVHEGVVYVTDSENHRIRAVTNLPA